MHKQHSRRDPAAPDKQRARGILPSELARRFGQLHDGTAGREAGGRKGFLGLAVGEGGKGIVCVEFEEGRIVNCLLGASALSFLFFARLIPDLAFRGQRKMGSVSKHEPPGHSYSTRSRISLVLLPLRQSNSDFACRPTAQVGSFSKR